MTNSEREKAWQERVAQWQASGPTLIPRRRPTSEHQIEQIGGKLRAMML